MRSISFSFTKLSKRRELLLGAGQLRPRLLTGFALHCWQLGKGLCEQLQLFFRNEFMVNSKVEEQVSP